MESQATQRLFYPSYRYVAQEGAYGAKVGYLASRCDIGRQYNWQQLCIIAWYVPPHQRGRPSLDERGMGWQTPCDEGHADNHADDLATNLAANLAYRQTNNS